MAQSADGGATAAAAAGCPSLSSRVASPVSSDSGCVMLAALPVLAVACSGLSGCLSESRKEPEALDADTLRLQGSDIGSVAMAWDAFSLIRFPCGDGVGTCANTCSRHT